jgi:hypothetical protein
VWSPTVVVLMPWCLHDCQSWPPTSVTLQQAVQVGVLYNYMHQVFNSQHTPSCGAGGTLRTDSCLQGRPATPKSD